MRDGTKISLGADSVFRISRYQPEAEEEPGAVFKLLEGVFRAVTGALTDDGGSLQVETRADSLLSRLTGMERGLGPSSSP